MFDAFALSGLFDLDTLWTAVRIAVTAATIVTLKVFIGNQTIVKLDDQEDLVDFNDFESFNTSSI